ncbi:hypothetical protein BU16DRAFT_10818 [Lophium mytilinum]|uniref:Uncharacterized protein n=1 Tax=Lophium mytilinum TaxID=390894 RepID=A0A6A6RD57_9PEZI|nr:hypothetical protein BU16DRAFT_10818 [Lophium mytilinum]
MTSTLAMQFASFRLASRAIPRRTPLLKAAPRCAIHGPEYTPLSTFIFSLPLPLTVTIVASHRATTLHTASLTLIRRHSPPNGPQPRPPPHHCCAVHGFHGLCGTAALKLQFTRTIAPQLAPLHPPVPFLSSAILPCARSLPVQLASRSPVRARSSKPARAAATSPKPTTPRRLSTSTLSTSSLPPAPAASHL